jgi:cell division protein FtsI (penicillin-binding protein 3)
VAGKTGTPQKLDRVNGTYSHRNHMAVFMGYVPAEKPRLLILVMIDEPKGVAYGGLVAGPVFREVGKWSLNNLHVNPKIRLAAIDENLQKGKIRIPIQRKEPLPLLEDPGFLPDFTGQTMREVLTKGSDLGLKVILEGTGLAFRQVPEPGSSLHDVSSVKISFRPPS